MSVLQILHFPDAEWCGVPLGGVFGIFNGKERPRKYEPESKTIKFFGLMPPESECTVVATDTASPANLNGTYLYTYCEADENANQGDGRTSGPPVDSEGATATVIDGQVTVTVPAAARNTDTTHFWIYRSAAGGTWPVLGRVARVAVGTTSWVDTGEDPDFINFPLDQNANFPPNKSFAMKMNRRLILWGSEPLETYLTFAEGSADALYSSGDAMDEGVIGAAAYPDSDTRGYRIDHFLNGSPTGITLALAYAGDITSPDSLTEHTKICRPAGELAWSEPDDYENFPAANVRYVELAGSDPETGCGAINGVGLLFTLHKTFRLAFDITPDTDYGVITELSASIGCLGNRTIQDCSGTLLWLAEGGIAASTGGKPVIISDEVAPVFDEVIKDSNGRCRRAFGINWAAKHKYFCFIPVSGDSEGCSKAIVVDYRQLPGEPQFRFTIYTFKKEFTCACIERQAVTDGTTTNYYEYPDLGDKDGYVWTFGFGDADGPDSGTVIGTVDSITTSPSTMTDASAAFKTSGLGLAGVPCTFKRTSDGSEQTLLIANNTATELTFTSDYDWLPGSTDTYEIGAIDAYYETGWTAFGADDRIKKLSRVITTHDVESGGSLDMNIYTDMATTPLALTNEGKAIDLSGENGRQVTKVSGKRVFLGKLRYQNSKPGEPWKVKSVSIDLEYDEP